MIKIKCDGLTIKETESVRTKILNRYKLDPLMTKKELSSKILSFVSSIKNQKLQYQNQYYQN